MWEKKNKDPIPIEYSQEPSFWWNKSRHFMSDFNKCNFSHWPGYIHAFEAESYNQPLYIEIIDGETINIWEKVA